MTTHVLRSWCHLYQPMVDGIKTHDLRVDDRNYQVGDILHLQEYDITKGDYTGREAFFDVTYITGRGKGQSPCAFSGAVMDPNYVILSVKKMAEITASQRYFIGISDACDRYLIPVDQYADWTDFVQNEDRWDDGEPAYAEFIDGGTLTFTDPKTEKLD